MRVLFLDIDGVLNTWEGLERYGWHYIDAERVSILKAIVYATEAKIVLSSTWRIKTDDYNMVKAVLLSQGMEIYDVTPQKLVSHRGHEIHLYLQNAVVPVTKYAVLDDDLDAKVHGSNFFQTDGVDGLTVKIAERVINHLNTENNPSVDYKGDWEVLKSTDPPRFNGGQECDMKKGPCSCGAWH